MATKKEVQVTYDVSNEFFKLWLDQKMSYTCALFEGTDDLDEAQTKKLEWICDAARVTPGMRVLDTGCGWGACLGHLTSVRGAREAVGITLSQAQLDEIERNQLENVKAYLCDYRDYQPEGKFDAVVSICMMEHIATQGDSWAKANLAQYRDYFRRLHEWTNPGAWLGLQTITLVRIPRDRKDLRDLVWMARNIFPGSSSPQLQDVITASSPYWELMEVRTRREDYSKTTAEWRRRLRLHEKEIREKWGDRVFEDYERYLTTCVMGFDKGYHSLAQYALRRID